MSKSINSKFLFVIFVAIWTSLYSDNVYAGHLTISGLASITTSVENGNVQFKGSYQIENSGDENAPNVFPSFKLGQWSWAGEPRLIAPMNKETWIIDSSFPLDLLGQSDTFAAGQELPFKGQFPLRVLRHYEDLNGFHFSVADIIGVAFGPLSPEEQSSLRVPDVVSSFICDGDGKLFTCLLDLRNQSDSAKKISISYHTSQELQIKSTSQIIDLAPRGQKFLESKIENIGGITGSSYAVFAVMQWTENSIRQGSSTAYVLKVHEPDRITALIYGSLGAILLSILLLYFFVFRNSGIQNVK